MALSAMLARRREEFLPAVYRLASAQFVEVGDLSSPVIGVCAGHDHLQAEHATLINYRRVKLNTNISPETFTIKNMKRLIH